MEEQDTSPAEENQPDNAKAKRLTEAEYAEAKELYELGKMRLVDLSEKYGVTRQALSQRFKNDGVSYGSRADEMQAAVSEGVKAAVATHTGQQVAAALERYVEKRLEWIEETRLAGYKSLKQADILAKKVVAEAIQNKAPMASTDDDLKAVQRFQKIIAENTLTRLEVLRAHEVIEEDDLPNITFADLTDEDILSHHRDNGLLEEGVDPEEVLAELAKGTEGLGE
jgi:hypothetical protein